MFVKLAGRHLSDEGNGSREVTRAPNARRYWPLGQLISARVREFFREPEALFWVYGFPILMTVALGIAFRNQRVEKIVVDVVDSPAAAATRDALAAAETSERFQVKVLPEEEAHMRLRTGRTDLIVLSVATTATERNRVPATNTASIRRGRKVCWRETRSTINCNAPAADKTWPT